MSKLSIGDIQAKYNPDQEVQHLRAQVEDLERRLKEEKRATGAARLRAREIAEAVEAVEPPKMVYKPTKHSGDPLTCVMHLTDLHDGAVIEANETEGLNAFNPDILTARLEKFASSVLEHVGVNRAGYNIPNLHILGTGDYIEGDIHYETAVTNAYPAPRQAVEIGHKIGALIRAVAPHFERVSVDFLSTDNHGRLTRKNQYAQGGENNYGYIAGSIAKAQAAAIENVEFRLHATQTMLVDIAGMKYLCFHGHQLKGWAGLPYYGFDRRLMQEAVKRMNLPELHFHKMVTGHFHVATDTLYWMIGGSGSGTSAFDHGQGRHAPAHQTSWFVHPRHGQFGFTRFWL